MQFHQPHANSNIIIDFRIQIIPVTHFVHAGFYLFLADKHSIALKQDLDELFCIHYIPISTFRYILVVVRIVMQFIALEEYKPVRNKTYNQAN